MHGKSTVESTMDWGTLDVRFMNSSYHVEMDWVSSNLECLSNIMQFNMSLIFKSWSKYLDYYFLNLGYFDDLNLQQ